MFNTNTLVFNEFPFNNLKDFSLSFQSAFHLSFTVLVRYRSLGLIVALDEIYHPLTIFVLYSQTTRLEESMSPIPPFSDLTTTRDCHPLWCLLPDNFGQRRKQVGTHWFQRLQFALRVTQERFSIWALPCSVALTKGILVSFFFLRLLICLNSAGNFTW